MNNKTEWIEIKVTVSQPYADSVAHVLIELGSNGVLEEALPSTHVNNDLITLKAYLKNDDRLDSCINNFSNYLISIFKTRGHQVPEFFIKTIDDDDWDEKWKSFFEPIRVTKNIVIKPSWRNYWKQEDEIVIELDPGMAFGTGAHPSTRLCLKAIEELACPPQSDEGLANSCPVRETCSLLDVGTGSGILAIAASMLGINWVTGIDIDLQAVECAKKNAAMNRISERVVFTGTSLEHITERFSIVVANILPQTLINMHKDLCSHLLPSGDLILSGILQEQAARVITAFRKDLLFTKEIKEGEWSCLLFKNVPVHL